MSESRPEGGVGDAAPPRTAGAMLRAAREREGLHLAVLAATIKVSPAKLDALEKDRYDQLPNPTFARALAQSVCRSLKVDPRPVLALLPQQETPPLESAVGRLNTPFHERSSRTDGGNGLAWASKPMFWAGGLLLVAAVAVGLVPRQWLDGNFGAARQPAPPASAAAASDAAAALSPAATSAAAAAVSDLVASSTAGTAALAVAVGLPTPASAAASAAALVRSAVATVASAAPQLVVASAPAAEAPAGPAGRAAGALAISVKASSWIEVIDADGRSLLSRVVQPGEALALDGRRPLRVTVGNAGGTELSFRGAAVDLRPSTRDNVARIELR